MKGMEKAKKHSVIPVMAKKKLDVKSSEAPPPVSQQSGESEAKSASITLTTLR